MKHCSKFQQVTVFMVSLKNLVMVFFFRRDRHAIFTFGQDSVFLSFSYYLMSFHCYKGNQIQTELLKTFFLGGSQGMRVWLYSSRTYCAAAVLVDFSN